MFRHRPSSFSPALAACVALLSFTSFIAPGALADEDPTQPEVPDDDGAADVPAEEPQQPPPRRSSAPANEFAFSPTPSASTPAPAPVSSQRLNTAWNDGYPSTLTYYPDQAIPDSYYLDTHPRYELVGAGIGILGGTWLASMGTALYYDNEPDGTDDPNFDDNYWPLFIPVAGPFIAIGTADSSGTGAAILALDGVVQTGALAMIIGGFVAPRTELVRKEWHFDVAPVVTPSMAGVGVSGDM